MNIEQLYTKCLSQGAYYIESEGEVAVIDPLREVDQYLEMAERDGAKIKYIFETHFHADFVSGHLTLAEKSGATIVYGPLAQPDFKTQIAKDGEVFQVGKLSLTALHTPGHTLESTTYLLKDEAGKQLAIFTGDTLFIGDVGRPDLAQKAADMTQEDLAGMLYDSLREKILPLNDDIVVYPAHGAGSACGKNMSSETQDTLGSQRLSNYALSETLSKEAFIKELTDGLLPPPAYFPENVRLNKEGYAHIGEVLSDSLKALDADTFENAMQPEDVLILDVRHQKDFVEGFIPGSIFIGIDGSFAPWVGAILKDVNQKLLLVTPAGREEETITRLARVGFDKVQGYLKDGFESWKTAEKPVQSITTESAQEMLNRIVGHEELVVDVRKPSEFNAGHVDKAKLFSLDFLEDELADFPRDKTVHVHCQSGYRSVIAGSVLKANGFDNIINVNGGYKAIQAADTSVIKTA
jgi:hydroxyacylglutathione hydrolase